MIELNGLKYAPLTDIEQNYVIVRCSSAGVFAGYLKSKNSDSVVLHDARRLWYWSGAASLSQLAQEGVKKPDECKFPCTIDIVELFGVIEIINCKEAARKNIANVPVWESKDA